MTGPSLFPIDLRKVPQIIRDSESPIAVVDDDTEQLDIIGRYYAKSKRSNELLVFIGAEELNNYMQSVLSGKSKIPAAIFLDINMPGLNGFEALKNLKAIKKFKDAPPVIMFSVSEAQADIETAMSLGADAYLTKPSNYRDYIQLFESI